MCSSSAPLVLPSDIPVDPSASEAQEWAVDELARAVYHQELSLWDRLANWLAETLANLLMTVPGGSSLIPVLVAASLAAAALLALTWHGSLQRTRRASSGSSPVFDDVRTSAQLRADSAGAALRGDVDAAVLDLFRALVRSLDEQAVLDDRPGLTAQEAAAIAATRFPPLAAAWESASRIFDSVRYGHRRAIAHDLHLLRELDASLRVRT